MVEVLVGAELAATGVDVSQERVNVLMCPSCNSKTNSRKQGGD